MRIMDKNYSGTNFISRARVNASMTVAGLTCAPLVVNVITGSFLFFFFFAHDGKRQLREK